MQASDEEQAARKAQAETDLAALEAAYGDGGGGACPDCGAAEGQRCLPACWRRFVDE